MTVIELSDEKAVLRLHDTSEPKATRRAVPEFSTSGIDEYPGRWRELWDVYPAKRSGLVRLTSMPRPSGSAEHRR